MSDETTKKNGNGGPGALAAESYVDPDVCDALRGASDGQDGIDWRAKVPEAEWREHEERLRSVIDAQQEAELLGTDVLIG